MSTGANCWFEQKGKEWFYRLQEWPYGCNPDYEIFGPFDSFRAAMHHLDKHHANPGGYSVKTDPDHPCDHPEDWTVRNMQDHLHCERCGTWVTEEDEA